VSVGTLGFAAPAIDLVVVDADAVQRRIRELGTQIARDYVGREIHIVAVLKGSIAVVADLLRAIDARVSVDFIAVSSYGPQSLASGAVRLLKDLDESLEGRHILVVEDVIDTGLTVNYILRILRSRHPASLEIATLIDKPAHRLIDLPIRYVGFTLPDIFVIGYGLDFRGRYRNLPYLATLKPAAMS
jgi:hypoxanthine phosphoribosyltransferase